MTEAEARAKLAELSCHYQHMRMTECPHCAREVESLVRALTNPSPSEKKEEERSP